MQVIPSNEYLVLITRPAALTADQRVPQRATLSADGTTFYVIRDHKGSIAVGSRSVKVIACGIKFKTKVK